MRSKLLCLYLLFLLLVPCSLFAQAQPDTLFLRNGEQLIGALKGIDQGEISFFSNSLYEVKLHEYKVRTISSTLHDLRVETTANEHLFGKFLPCTDTVGAVYLVDDKGKSTRLMLDHISSAMSFNHGALQKLEGKLGAGMSFSRSADIGLVNINTSLKYTTPRSVTEVTLATLSSIAKSGFTRDQEKVQATYYYVPAKSSWVGVTFLTYQRNLELLLARRFQGVVGAGARFATTQHFTALAVTGISGSNERSITGQSSKSTLFELPVVIKLDYFKFGKANMRIGMTHGLYKGLSQTNRFRYDGNLNVEWEFMENLSITTNFYTNYDSKPLSSPTAKTDYGVVMGVSYTL
ncbi:MAG: DUF481 domain-containing protein [Mucilaginibacter sp.]